MPEQIEPKTMPTTEALRTLFLCFCRQYNQMGETLMVIAQLMVKMGLVPQDEIGPSPGFQGWEEQETETILTECDGADNHTNKVQEVEVTSGGLKIVK